jgi:hypothetical protein
MMGGDVIVRSEPGKGSVARVASRPYLSATFSIIYDVFGGGSRASIARARQTAPGRASLVKIFN